MNKKLREIRFNDEFLIPIDEYQGKEIHKITISGVSKDYIIENNICTSYSTFKDFTLVLNRSEIYEDLVNDMKDFYGIYNIELIYENSPKESFYATSFDDGFNSLMKITKTNKFIIISINERNKYDFL